jgi:hypothetical protein
MTSSEVSLLIFLSVLFVGAEHTEFGEEFNRFLACGLSYSALPITGRPKEAVD